MKLTAKGAATRRRIVEGTAAHLRGHGPGTVTLDEVREITGTSKGQIFHYFPGGKDELLLAVAHFEADRVIEDQQPHLDALTTWGAWDRWRAAVLARYRAQGPLCPLATLMGQIAGTPGAAAVIRELLERWQQPLRDGICVMQEAGEIDPGVDPDRFAAALVAGIQGGVQILRSTGNSDALEAALDVAVEHLRAQRPRGASADALAAG